MVRLDRRTLEKLEAKRSKVMLGKYSVPDELLERYFQLLENHQAELEGRPPPHPDPPEEPYDPELGAYFQDLEFQRAQREEALRQTEAKMRRRHDG